MRGSFDVALRSGKRSRARSKRFQRVKKSSPTGVNRAPDRALTSACCMRPIPVVNQGYAVSPNEGAIGLTHRLVTLRLSRNIPTSLTSGLVWLTGAALRNVGDGLLGGVGGCGLDVCCAAIFLKKWLVSLVRLRWRLVVLHLPRWSGRVRSSSLKPQSFPEQKELISQTFSIQDDGRTSDSVPVTP